MEIIQRSIDHLGAHTYLEIGVFDGACFCSVKVASKIGVDPIPAAQAVASELTGSGVHYFSLTSDDFFQSTAPRVLKGGADIVFIDGLHTAAQAYRDCINSLEYLNPGGLILMHDCLPTSELEARVAQDLDHAKKLNAGAAWDGEWVGDVWKAVVKLRALRPDLQTCVLNCDHGIGLVYKGENRNILSLTPEQIDALTYDDLTKDTKRLLGLRNPSYLIHALEKIAGQYLACSER